jgi:hypothetical protein
VVKLPEFYELFEKLKAGDDGRIAKLIDFGRDEIEIRSLFERDLQREGEIYGWCCGLLRQVIMALATKKNDKNCLEKAVVVVLKKILSHARTAWYAVLNGWYGDAVSIAGAIERDSNMILYLCLYPENLDLWFAERRDSFQTNKEFKDTFLESTILKKLEEKGITTDKNAFGIGSKTLHGSFWGAQVYWGKDGKFIAGPDCDFNKSINALMLVLFSVLWVLIWCFKEHKAILQTIPEFERKDFEFTFGFISQISSAMMNFFQE